LALIGAGYLYGRDYVRRHPEEFPWTRLDLKDPIGRFTAPKLAALGNDAAQCRALLDAVNSDDVPAPSRSGGPECG